MARRDTEFNQLCNDLEATQASFRHARTLGERAAADRRAAAVFRAAEAMVDDVIRETR